MRKGEQDEQTGKKKKQGKSEVPKIKPSRIVKQARTEENKARRIARDKREKARHIEKWKQTKSPVRGTGRILRRSAIIAANRPKREQERAAAHRRAVLAWQVYKADNPSAVMQDFLTEFHRGAV